MALTTAGNADTPDDVDPVTMRPFRFKQNYNKDKEGEPYSAVDGSEGRRRERRHHRRHHRSHKRRKLSDEGSESLHRNNNDQLPLDVAFRESLFDAMGDDEGAAFWQGVYGQPIHTYPKTYEDAETGELETMDDEQYAQYVRRKMWEKSVEGIEAAREAKGRELKEERARRKQEEEEQSQDQREYAPKTEAHKNHDFVFDLEIEESLQRGARRKANRRWQETWKAYQDKWQKLQDFSQARNGPHADDSEQVFLRNKIAWPVESGRRKDVGQEEVERFIEQASSSQRPDDPSFMSKANLVKNERVRWHPDKVQQRYGFMQIDEGTMAGVTAVFQILDRLWNDIRNGNA
ncbi:hypothetical protein H2198_007621 [Neophaeococcomyces mojaviensis]|uniref:Uncharacterized protein n=1 Tax=Neophaeococcomyces mojaviensis TaxID=3383035 RepID=A0ACC2ZZX5_9EURO|nr:hypothetical protein H2198_007621 [Knufia sp. JES_112]